ncbi:MAG: peptidase S10 [Chloroflexi bacterium]|nr:peptidase S10 [Chloroflexota bacterium]MBI3338963.1 peptidase S10 [Chloroflexota bacterium]
MTETTEPGKPEEEKPALPAPVPQAQVSKGEGKDEKKEEKPKPKDNLVETKHAVTINGREIKYTVITGTMVLKEETPDREKESEGEKPRAQIFFVAYTKDDVGDKAKRPLTFSFNGGPGSSSVWLHLGLLGPRRVVLEDDGSLPKPPFKLTDSEYSLLDETDLVFIDPMNTGYSRPVEGEKPKEWHGFKKDITSVGDFIRLYTTRYNRWLSPKFLIGESYGTTRASGLSGYLQERHGMYLNGIMLISAALDFSTIDFTINNELPYVMFLPAYAATAWYHHKLKVRKPLQTLLKEVEKFAQGEYAAALLKGDTLTKRERAQIIEKMSRYTGLSPEFIDRSNLRINDQHFFKELLRERGQTVGRLDSRFIGRDRLGVTERPEYDPLLTNVMGPYTATFYDYIRSELKFESDLPYEILSDKVWPWSYAEFENQFVNVGETLRAAMTYNPYLKVFVANGYFDLGTPYFATEYTFNHLGLHESARKNVSMGYYEAGHMMYIHLPSLAELKKDLAEFIQGAM